MLFVRSGSPSGSMMTYSSAKFECYVMVAPHVAWLEGAETEARGAPSSSSGT